MKKYLATAAVAAYAVAAIHSATVRAAAAVQAPEAQTSKSVWDGVYTEEQAKRGAALYKQWCSSCHGAELEGGEMAPGLVGGGFTSNWNGLTIGDIFDRTRTTMPQDSPGALSREQVADITAFVLSMNKFPAGSTELATQSEMLKQIKFEATKPGH
jgi:mono/diheme cytochrome c family protein